MVNIHLKVADLDPHDLLVITVFVLRNGQAGRSFHLGTVNDRAWQLLDEVLSGDDNYRWVTLAPSFQDNLAIVGISLNVRH